MAYSSQDLRCLTEGRVDGMHLAYFQHGEPIILPISTLTNPDLSLLNPLLYENIQRLKEILADKGISLVLLPVPPRPLVFAKYLDPKDPIQASYDSSKMRQAYLDFVSALNNLGVVTTDILTPLEAYPPSFQPLNLFSDNHWSPLGAELSAKALAQTIQTQLKDTYERLHKRRFVTEYLGDNVREHPLIDIINQICGGHIQATIPSYKTSPMAGDLLADEHIEVVYLGTSYGSDKFNFTGFLKEALSVDILNYSLGGGTMFGALEEFLLHERERLQDTKLIVWEFPFIDVNLTTLQDAEMSKFRELVANLEVGCKEIARATLNITTPEGEASYALLQQRLDTRATRLILSFSDENVREFDLRVKYLNDSEDSYNFRRLDRITAKGRFFLELPKQGRIKELRLELLEPTQGTVTARFCR
ncbi:MAG: hypothetical protein R2865_17770 [Deinococcales bacterium]